MKRIGRVGIGDRRIRLSSAITLAVVVALGTGVFRTRAQMPVLPSRDGVLTALVALNGHLSDEHTTVEKEIALVDSKNTPIEEKRSHLDASLSHLDDIHGEGRDKLTSALAHLPFVWDIPFESHFLELDCIDYQLVLSVEDAKESGNSTPAQVVAIKKQIVARYKAARRCIKDYQEGLGTGTGVPPEVKPALDNIDGQLENAETAVNKIPFSAFSTRGVRSVANRAKEIATEKGNLMVAEYPAVYGLKFFDVFQSLFTVDSELKAVTELIKQLQKSLGGKPTDLTPQKMMLEQMERELAHARQAKDALEKLFVTCRAGSFTSDPLKVTAPSGASGAQYYFTTPIPNWAYYDHKHGFTGGGCNHEQGKVLVNIQVLGDDGRPVAWTLEYGAGISPGPGQAPEMVHSGNYCPFTQGNNTFYGCRIDNPSLAFPLPSQGYTGLASGNASDDPSYAVNIDVHPAAPGGNNTGTVHVLVTWKLPGT